MKATIIIASVSWTALWLTADQQAHRQFERGNYQEAARNFTDPMWQGTALYRDGAFEDAAKAFARRDSAEAYYNQGNAWLMHGQYKSAIEAYEKALEQRPGWTEARENRDLAEARGKKVERTGGDMGDQTLGADEIRFDPNKKPGGQETEVNDQQAARNSDFQSMWLRRVQTEPADFLKAKFSYQYNVEGSEP